VRNLGHNVIGVAPHPIPTLVRARQEQKSRGLILADIQLADGKFRPRRPSTSCCAFFEVPVVFITAYPGTLPDRRGARNRHFLISKPFQPAMVSAVASPGPVLPAQFAQPRARGRRLPDPDLIGLKKIRRASRARRIFLLWRVGGPRPAQDRSRRIARVLSIALPRTISNSFVLQSSSQSDSVSVALMGELIVSC